MLRPGDRSKTATRKTWEILKTAIRLRWHEEDFRRFAKFVVVGTIGLAVNAVMLEVFRRGQVTESVALYFSDFKDSSFLFALSSQSSWSAAAAAELAIVSNFILNNLWTFSLRRIRSFQKLIWKFSQFNLTSIGAVLIQFFVVGFFTTLISDTIIVRQGSMLFSVVFLVVPYNWLIYNKIIWKYTI
jgi:putative flippase GtrA